MTYLCQECGEPLDDDQDPDESPLCELCEVEGTAARMMLEDALEAQGDDVDSD